MAGKVTMPAAAARRDGADFNRASRGAICPFARLSTDNLSLCCSVVAIAIA